MSATPNRLHIGWGIGTLGASTLLNSFAALQLYYLTDVLGVYERYPDETSLISQIDVAGMERLLDEGKVGEGMIPKLRSCIEAIEAGVGRAHILDGRVPHALLLEFFTREGIGTMITREQPVDAKDGA